MGEEEKTRLFGLASGSNGLAAEIAIVSSLELKKIAKIIPENTLFSYQDHVNGIQSGFFSNEEDDN